MSATKHNSTGMDGSHYRVPPEPNRWPAIGLAVGVHAVLLAFLVIGINWTNNQPVAVEAEVWDTSVQQAAPPAPQPEPQPEPEPETPPPAPRVVETPPPPPKVEPAPPKPPEIALEREKKRKEELKRQKLEEERLEQERERERERELAEQKREQEKKDKALADKKKREEEKKAEEKQAQELAKKEEADKKKKEKAEKEKLAKAEAAKLEKLRAEEMKRLTGGAGTSGSAEKSTAPRIDKGYIASIAAKIKSNTTYPGSTDVPGNPEVEFQVSQLPSGEIVSVRKTKSSGIPAFDDAVERGINKSSPLPKKKDGTVERSLPVNFKLKDLN